MPPCPAQPAGTEKHLSDGSQTAGSDQVIVASFVLATYTGQVKLLERLLTPKVDGEGRLQGFVSPRGDRRFVYTSDSFQGGEADVVLASLVRNNTTAGKRALGFLSNPQRLNVLVSRAKQKLVLATSLEFLTHVVDSTDPDKAGGDLGFVRTLVRELRETVSERVNGEAYGATIVPHDERGNSVG